MAELKSSPSSSQRRGTYTKYTTEQKAQIGKRAAEEGVVSTIRYYAKRYPNLKESSVRDWRNAYTLELKKRRGEGDESAVMELPEKKRGRPLLIGEDFDGQVQAYLNFVREKGGVVNTAIAISCAEGIIMNKDSSLLACNGGHISLTKDWGKNTLYRMGLVKRKGTTKAKVSVDDFDVLKAQFLLDIKVVIEMEEIPSALVINWDQTGINYVPVSAWTMAKAGSKRVEISGVDDKRQITGVFGCNMVGDFLPIQLVYQGKTPKCIPSFNFPSDWHITFSSNHWCNESTMKNYVEKILFPYVQRKREELKLSPNHHALVLFDMFKGQCTQAILELLETNNIDVVFIPANCTDRLQPLDVSVNKPAKTFLRGQFQDWYAKQVCKQLEVERDVEKKMIDLRLSIMKPLGAKWLVYMYDYFKSKPEIIMNGFKSVGITDYVK